MAETAQMAAVAAPASAAVVEVAQAAPNPNVGGANHPRLTIGADGVAEVRISVGSLGLNGYIGGYAEVFNSLSGSSGYVGSPIIEGEYFMVKVPRSYFGDAGTYYAKLTLTYEPATTGGYNRQEVIIERLLEVYRSENLIQYPEDKRTSSILGFDNW